MGILERIQEIEREIARTQKNKGKCQLQFKKLMHTVSLWGSSGTKSPGDRSRD